VIEKTSDSFSDRKWKPLDVGMSFGAGVEFPTANNLELELRYYKGLSDFQDIDGGPSLKNNSLLFSLAVKM
jgi:opacity protein-like surface antigen